MCVCVCKVSDPLAVRPRSVSHSFSGIAILLAPMRITDFVAGRILLSVILYIRWRWHADKTVLCMRPGLLILFMHLFWKPGPCKLDLEILKRSVVGHNVFCQVLGVQKPHNFGSTDYWNAIVQIISAGSWHYKNRRNPHLIG